MELQPRERPPDYSLHRHLPDDLRIRLPAVPKHDFAHPPVQSDITLPALSTVLSPDYQARSPSSSVIYGPASPTSIRGFPRTEFGYTHMHEPRRSVESSVVTPSEAGSVTSMDDRRKRSMSVLSMEDPDVRIAAEALSGLGNPDFARSPESATVLLPTPTESQHEAHPDLDTEPMLQLLTQAHPWVGGAVNGSLSAYSTTKHFSPRMVQYGANLIERNITIPLANSVSSVGKLTGVESGLRWYLGARRPSDMEAGFADESGNKRRRIDENAMDLEAGPLTPGCNVRRDSQESRVEYLPAYRPSKPPSYREEESPSSKERIAEVERQATARSLSSQVFIMTSGLGVALSQKSRQSLRFCLARLSQATEHISTVMDALKLVLEQYDEAREHWHQTYNNNSAIEKGERPRTPDHDQAARRLAEIIKKHSDDIWRTLKSVVTFVSATAGGALPENAHSFVRSQLMSLPQRWQVVSHGQIGDSETSRGAHRMIAFATEGLDMMSQVSQVCKATLDSADLWLQRVGRRRAHHSRRATSINHSKMLTNEKDGEETNGDTTMEDV